MPARSLLSLLLVLLLRATAMSQTIHGEVLAMDDKKPMADVAIENIYTGLTVSSSEQGAFVIAGSGGQLLEFKRPGYKTARVRIPQGYVPAYFRIIMQKGLSPIENRYAGETNRYDPKDDSIRYRELYKHELDFPKMSAVEKMNHPFSAMSARNREIWQFQDDYAEFEKEKYVDKTFNAGVITKFTGLKGDSLTVFMRRYRPTYEQLRSMNDYAFYNFVKGSVHHFRTKNTPRGAQ